MLDSKTSEQTVINFLMAKHSFFVKLKINDMRIQETVAGHVDLTSLSHECRDFRDMLVTDKCELFDLLTQVIDACISESVTRSLASPFRVDDILVTESNGTQMLKEFKYRLARWAIDKFPSMRERLDALDVSEKTLYNWENRI